MTDILTTRLQLHAIDVVQAERIVARRPAATDTWADDFPFEGDVIAVTNFLRASIAIGELRPFGHYVVTRRSDSQAIGGIGFKDAPVDGFAEIGYGLVRSARGNGFAAEALSALVTLAEENGLSRLIAETTPDNIASQRTLTKTGFDLVHADVNLNHYEILFAGPTTA